MGMVQDAAAALEIGHRRVWSTDEAHLVEAVFTDEMQGCHGVAVARAEVEQPVGTLDDLPPAPDLDDREIGRVEGEGVFAGESPARRRTGVVEPVHHRCHVATGGRPTKHIEASL